MKQKSFGDWYAIRESIGEMPADAKMDGSENLSQEGQTAAEQLKTLLQGSPPEVVMAALADQMKLMHKYHLDPHEVKQVIGIVRDELLGDGTNEATKPLKTLLTATEVGDSYRDMGGGISTVAYKDDQRVIIRRSPPGGRGWPSFSVFGIQDGRMYGTIGGIYRTMKAAMEADLTPSNAPSPEVAPRQRRPIDMRRGY